MSPIAFNTCNSSHFVFLPMGTKLGVIVLENESIQYACPGSYSTLRKRPQLENLSTLVFLEIDCLARISRILSHLYFLLTHLFIQEFTSEPHHRCTRVLPRDGETEYSIDYNAIDPVFQNDCQLSSRSSLRHTSQAT